MAILGEPRIKIGDRPVALSTPALAIVTALARAHPHTVPAEELVAAVPGSPLTLAALHTAIWRLRRRLGPESVVRVGSGYAFGVAVNVDRNDLQAALRMPPPDTVEEAREIVVALGSLLDHWEADPARSPTRRGAEDLELWADAVECWAGAAIVTGESEGCLARLETLVGIAPTRERAWTLFVQASEASPGADAQKAARRALDAVNDAGLNPGPLLAPAVRRTLGVTVTAKVPGWLEASARLPFVGRSEELGALLQAIESAGDGLCTVVVAGEPGSGRTRLIAEAARLVTGRGVRVWAGRWDRHGAVPHRALVEVLEQAVADAPDETFSLFAGGPFARLVTGEADEDHGEEVGGPEHLRAQIADVLTRAVGSEPALLVLEDAHWADPESLEVVHHVARSRAGLPLAVVVSVQDPPVGHGASTEVLGRLVHEPGTRHLRLGGLRSDELASLPELVAIAARVGEDPMALGRWVRAVTGGNPMLAVRLIEDPDYLVRLHRSPEPLLPTAEVPVPARLRAAVEVRLAGLDDKVRRGLAVAALVGTSFAPPVLHQVLGPDAEEALAWGIDVGILHVSGSQVAFVHDLVAEVLAQSLGAADRFDAHLAVAEALAERTESGRPADLHAVALHLARAGPAAPAGRATAVALEAAELAISQLGFSLAGECLELAAATNDDEAIDLLVRAAQTAQLDGDFGSALRRLSEAETRARADGRPAQLARVALGRAELAFRGGIGDAKPTDDVRDLLIEAQERLDPGGEPALDADLSFAAALFEPPGALTTVLSYVESPVDRVRIADRGALVGSHDDRVPLVSRLVEEAATSPEAGVTAALWDWITAVEEGRARLDDAERDARLAELLTQVEDPELRWRAEVWRATRLIATGDFDHGAAGVETAFRQARSSGVRADWVARAAVVHRIQRGFVNFYTVWGHPRPGDMVPVEPMWSRGARTWRQNVAFTLARSGASKQGRAMFEQACDEALDRPGIGGGWLSQLSLLAGTAHALGDRDRARALLSALAPWSGHHGMNAEDCYAGAMDHQAGLLHQVIDDLDGAVAAFTAAIAAHEAVGAAPFATLSRMQLAVTLHRRGSTGDRTAARDLAALTRAEAAALGMPRVESVLSALD